MKKFRAKLESFRSDKGGFDGSALETDLSAEQTSSEPQTPLTPSVEASGREHRNETPSPASPFLSGQTRGLRILKNPPESTLDIIFIHGLTGDSLRTWQHQPSGVYWPTDLLPKEFPEARILSFGYDADVTKLFGGAVGQGTLRNHATTLVSEYSMVRRRDISETESEKWGFRGAPDNELSGFDQLDNNDTRRKRVIIVAHSLGGLVTKKALCISSASVDDNEKALDSDIIGLCFLGTPHRGSDKAEIALMASKMVKLTGKRVNSRILGLLKPDSEVLDDIQAEFGMWLRKNNQRMSVASFFEEHEMSRIGMIVTQSSALIEGYPHLPIPSNHRDMTKFCTINDIGLVRIMDQMRVMVSQKRANKKPTNVTPQLLSGYEDCLRALSFPDMNRRYGSILPASDGTCSWLVEHPVYEEWMASCSGIMWILGHPGTGKSTLMKHVVQKLTHAQTIRRGSSLILSFFFYNSGSELQKSIEGMLRAVLFQIIEAIPSLLGDLSNISKTLTRNPTDNSGFGGVNMSRRSLWESTELTELLEKSISLVLEHTDIWLFVDALDECRTSSQDTDDDTQEIQQLVRYLRRILGKVAQCPHKIRICCSCRHYPIIASLKDGYKIFAEKENSRDIKEYITQELDSEVLPDHRGLLETLVETISSKAMGSFQWTYLVTRKAISMYKKGKTPSQIYKCMDELPKHLSDLYDSILSSIPENDRAQSLKLFEWACLSTSGPLELPTLRLMMNIDPQQRPRSFKDLENVPEFIQDDIQMELMVQSLSGGLAELSGADIDNSTYYSYTTSSSGESASSSKDVSPVVGRLPDMDWGWAMKMNITYLVPIHQSVKDYMMTRGFRILNQSSVSVDTYLAEAYRNMSISCLLAVTMQHPTTNHPQPLSQYSQEDLHYDETTLCDLVDWTSIQKSTDRTVYKAMSKLFRFLKKLSNPRYMRFNPLEHDVSLLQQYISLMRFESGYHRETALILLRNYLAWLNFLQSYDIGFSTFQNIFAHALEAKKRCMDGMEKQLISALPNSAMQDPLFRLYILLNACYEDLPELLCYAFTFTIRMDNRFRQILLYMAASEGSYQVSSILLDGCGIFFKEPFEDQKALMLAAKNGYIKVVELLLAHGANINQTNYGMGTALHQASENGHIEIVKLLLAHGADIHQTDNKMATPLHWAVDGGQEQICRILLDGGAEVDARNDLGETPFMYVVQDGNRDVYDILIGYSPNIDATDKLGYTVLYYAVKNGNMDIVRALMCGKQRPPNADPLTESSIRQSGFEALKKDNVEFFELAIRWKDIEFLLAAGISIASAAAFDAVSCFEFFLHHQQGINSSSYQGATTLHWAALRGNISIASTLLDQDNIDLGRDYNLDINSLDIKGATPLDLALEATGKAAAAFLRSHKSDNQAEDHWMKLEACKSIVRKLRAHGAICGNYIASENVACETMPNTTQLCQTQRRQLRRL